jgi:hypothetical protein
VNQVLRIAVAWLLMLAVPIQGIAAVSMLSCGPGHLRTTAASPEQDRVNHGHASHLVVGAVEDPAPSRESIAPDGASADTPVAGELDKVAKYKWSACTACCLGLPACMVTFDLVTPSAGVIRTATVSLAPFLTGCPERPPRLLV